MRDGEGSMTYASGNRYEGSWQRDKKNGYGVMRWLNLREKYAGGWADDMQSGYGEHVWMDDKPAEGSLGVLKQVGRWVCKCNVGQETRRYLIWRYIDGRVQVVRAGTGAGCDEAVAFACCGRSVTCTVGSGPWASGMGRGPSTTPTAPDTGTTHTS
jgi:hypothetical protein